MGCILGPATRPSTVLLVLWDSQGARSNMLVVGAAPGAPTVPGHCLLIPQFQWAYSQLSKFHLQTNPFNFVERWCISFWSIHSQTTPLFTNFLFVCLFNQLAHISIIRKFSTKVPFCHSGDLPQMSVSHPFRWCGFLWAGWPSDKLQWAFFLWTITDALSYPEPKEKGSSGDKGRAGLRLFSFQGIIK